MVGEPRIDHALRTVHHFSAYDVVRRSGFVCRVLSHESIETTYLVQSSPIRHHRRVGGGGENRFRAGDGVGLTRRRKVVCGIEREESTQFGAFCFSATVGRSEENFHVCLEVKSHETDGKEERDDDRNGDEQARSSCDLTSVAFEKTTQSAVAAVEICTRTSHRGE